LTPALVFLFDWRIWKERYARTFGGMGAMSLELVQIVDDGNEWSTMGICMILK